MAKKLLSERVNIRPGVSILSVLSRLNYHPWFALAEFVDNSIQSFIDHKIPLRKLGVKRLRVEIKIYPHDSGKIVIRDNSSGIALSQFTRAFRAAEVPLNTSGLHEYGMGMKSAACWFSKNWSVRTSAIGDPYIRNVHFDIKKIVEDKIEELAVDVEASGRAVHFTEISLRDLNRIPKGRTIGKIKQHLSSIYRHFIKDGFLELIFDDEVLEYKEPNILKARHFKEAKGKSILWRIPIDFTVSPRKRVTGFAALRETGGASDAGFALFRKRRLIQGSADDGYRPEAIFGKPNSYTYQRLFGELHLDGFDVSHTKDGFVWHELEEELIAKLEKVLASSKPPLLAQAEGYRSRTPKDKFDSVAPQVLKAVAADVQKRSVADAIGGKRPASLKIDPPSSLPKRNDESRFSQKIELHFRDEKWVVNIEVVSDPIIKDFVEVSDFKRVRDNPRRIGIRVSTAHPFIAHYMGADMGLLEPFMKIAVALVLAETAARDGGAKNASIVRGNFNEILRKMI